MRTIERRIVGVLIESEDGLLLLGRKDPQSGAVYADCWQIPGGGVEEGETIEQAIVREVQEEIGLQLSPEDLEFLGEDDGGAEKTLTNGERVFVNMHFHNFRIRLKVEAKSISPELREEFVELRWFAIADLSTVPLTPPGTNFFRRFGYLPAAT